MDNVMVDLLFQAIGAGFKAAFGDDEKGKEPFWKKECDAAVRRAKINERREQQRQAGWDLGMQNIRRFTGDPDFDEGNREAINLRKNRGW